MEFKVYQLWYYLKPREPGQAFESEKTFKHVFQFSVGVNPQREFFLSISGSRLLFVCFDWRRPRSFFLRLPFDQNMSNKLIKVNKNKGRFMVARLCKKFVGDTFI